jgi:hypothetical protein
VTGDRMGEKTEREKRKLKENRKKDRQIDRE